MAKLLKGAEVVLALNERIRAGADALKAQGVLPTLAVVRVGERADDIAYERGLIIYSRRTRGGVEGDHFLVCPPMITTEAQVGEIVTILDATLAQLSGELSLPVTK